MYRKKEMTIFTVEIWGFMHWSGKGEEVEV